MNIAIDDLFQTQFMVQYSQYLPVFLFIVCFLEVVVPPIPGDTLLILGSSMSAVAGVPLVWLIISAFAGTYAASLVIYKLGSKLGTRILDSPRFAWLLDSATFIKIQRWFERYGYWTLMFSRLLPMARSGVALTAGIVNYPRAKTMMALALSVGVSVTLFVMLGRLLGERWIELYRIWHPRLNRIILISAGVVFTGFFSYMVFKLFRKKRPLNSEKR
jgi:membrane protein DedA with SNARE-associated domain